MSRRKTRGFTLVEMLVVISIIGMLAALLLPAIQSAREAGRKSVCTNNQRQIGLAFTRYEQTNNELPGYMNVQAKRAYGDTDGDGFLDGAALAPPVKQMCTWVFPLLPYLERQDLYEEFGPKARDAAGVGSRRGMALGQTNVMQLNVLLCPSDSRAAVVPAFNGLQKAPMSFVVNTGMPDWHRSMNAPVPSAEDGASNTGNVARVAGQMPSRDSAANGVFHDRYPDYFSGSPAGTQVPEVIMNFAYISNNDGLSTTIMHTENVDSGNWNHNACGFTPNGNVVEEQVGCVWWPQTNGSAYPNSRPTPPDASLASGIRVCPINSSAGLIDSLPSATYPRIWFARPASFHPGSVTVTFCDSHTQSVKDTIDYLVYCLLMTPRGKAITLYNHAAYISTAGAITISGPANPVAANYFDCFTRTILDESSFDAN